MKGEISEEALLKYSQLAAESLGLDFSEGEDTYDFTRCVRPDGSAYGTRGKCRKGTEGGPAPQREGTGARGAREAAASARAKGAKGGALLTARAQGKKDALAASRAAGGKKVSEKGNRARLLQQELEKVRDQMKGAPADEQNRLLQAASSAADRRAKAGEAVEPAKKKAPSEGLDQTKKRMKAGRAGYLGEKAAKVDRGPHYDAIRQAREELKDHLEELKSRKSRLKDFQAAAKANEKRHKEDPSKENKARVKEALRQLAEHDRHVRRQEKVATQAHRKWARLHERNERAKMSPAQRAEAKRIDALIREHG